jgi:hypothetical protein
LHIQKLVDYCKQNTVTSFSYLKTGLAMSLILKSQHKKTNQLALAEFSKQFFIKMQNAFLFKCRLSVSLFLGTI